MLFDFLAIDPGGTTGICHIVETEHQYNIVGLCLLRDIDQLRSFLCELEPSLIVCEDFVGSGAWKSTQHLIPPRLIGGILMWGLLYGTPVVLQTPSQRHLSGAHELSSTLLKDLQVYAKYKAHLIDSTAHAIFYINQQVKSTDRKIFSLDIARLRLDLL